MNLKKVLVLAGVALVLFLLITRPEQSATAVQQVLSWLRDGAESIITFIRALFGTASPYGRV
jgi:cell shape-determining protein MreC